MSEAVPSPSGSDEELDYQSSFVLGESGWEATDYVEPGPGWRLTSDGSYESPDGRLRSYTAAEPVEWSDAVVPGEH